MMTKLDRGLSLAAIAVIAVALGAGPAQARGGLKAETVELLPVPGLIIADESVNGDPNANASAVTAYQSKRQPAPTTTVWTAIAEDLLPGEIYHLFNRDPDGIECDTNDYNVVLPLVDGNLLNATTLGQSSGEAKDTVDVCRAVIVDDEIVDWVWILTGSLKGGAQGGGKNPNK